MKHNCKFLFQEVSPAALFPKPPIVPFRPESQNCSCGPTLKVQKTRYKKVLSMLGPYIAHETVLECPQCFQVFTSESLLSLVKSHSNVSLDVLVFVGRALYQRHLSLEKVQTELLLKNVRVSLSEIDYLGRKFIFYLALGHAQATPGIRIKMQMNSGYVLHLDATHEGDAPTLMSGIDSLSRFVLANVKISGEKAVYIRPFLQEIKSTYGTPLACVHDMGTGICKAVNETLPGVPDFTCHFHFLRDIGKDFFEPAYAILRGQLRKHAATKELRAMVRDMRQRLSKQGTKISSLIKAIKNLELPESTENLPLASAYSLALWALHGKNSGHGYGFPFDRPLLQFANRLLQLNHALPNLLEITSSLKGKDRKALVKLSEKISQIAHDPKLNQAVEELRWRTQIFDDLRSAMRIALPNGKYGLNDEGTSEAMHTIRQSVEGFKLYIKTDPKLADDHLCNKMLQQIDKYNEKLFADPIIVSTPNGNVTIYPQRTNNIIEQFFRDLRRAHRKKTGYNSIHRKLQAMIADTPLVKNLDNRAYMEVLLNGKSDLEELFADLAKQEKVAYENSKNDSDRILPGFRSIIKFQNLPEQVMESLKKKFAKAA